jgi:hypothetical protein
MPIFMEDIVIKAVSGQEDIASEAYPELEFIHQVNIFLYGRRR